MNLKIESVYQLLAFLINPFLGLISALYYMFKRNKTFSILSISLSLSLVFVYLPIMFDVSGRFYSYLYYKHNHLLDTTLYDKIAVYLNQLLNLQYMTTVFIYTTIILFIWFFIFNFYRERTYTVQTLVLMVVFVLSSILYRNIMDLQRFYLAVSIFLFVTFLIEHNLYKIGLVKFSIFIILASTIHSAAILLVLIYTIAKIKLGKKFFILLPFIALIIGKNSYAILSLILDLPIFSLIDQQTLHLIRGYIDPNSIWGSANMRFSLVILRYIEIPLMFLIYYKGFKLLEKDQNNTSIKFSLLLMSIVLIFTSYVTLYERYSTAFFLFSVFIIYKVILETKKDIFIWLILGLFIFRSFFINYHLYGEIFTSKYNNILPDEQKKLEMILKPFYYPTPLLLWIEENGYSDEYIKNEATRGKKF